MKYKNHDNIIIAVNKSEYPENPREYFENTGTMYCFHSRYSLGDKHDLSIEDVKELENSSKYLSLPLYGYDHGSLAISTEPFSCRFDSGKLGIICALKDSNTTVEDLKTEVDDYNCYLNNDVYEILLEDCVEYVYGHAKLERFLADGNWIEIIDKALCNKIITMIKTYSKGGESVMDAYNEVLTLKKFSNLTNKEKDLILEEVSKNA